MPMPKTLLFILIGFAGFLAAQPSNRPNFAPPKAGVCPLPILPAVPELNDTSFFATRNVPHGKLERPTYKNYSGDDKSMHVYLPPD